MNNINDFIKNLSIKDKKTLSQKTLKLVEEVGELSRVILPYDSAHGTNHRFIDRDAILEEVVDVYLTNISIAHSLGFTDEEFSDMLVKKSKKWSQLQSGEEKAEFPLPFEIHVTVSVGDEFDGLVELEHFKQSCVEIGVKPIVIDLEMKEDFVKDVMTSSKHFGDNRSAYEESERICNELKKYGYKVLRNKIESVPWHMKAPSVLTTDKEIPNGCYFESHIGITIKPDEKDRLNDFVNNLPDIYHKIYNPLNLLSHQLSGIAKLSQNFFKKSKDGSKFVNMLTYRSNKCGRYKFESEVNSIKELLSIDNFNFEKVEVEYAVYDTNTNHDSKWING
jgi:NTP pyrophosphatase (non-canonical NTP hydrolase)